VSAASRCTCSVSGVSTLIRGLFVNVVGSDPRRLSRPMLAVYLGQRCRRLLLYYCYYYYYYLLLCTARGADLNRVVVLSERGFCLAIVVVEFITVDMVTLSQQQQQQH